MCGANENKEIEIAQTKQLCILTKKFLKEKRMK